MASETTAKVWVTFSSSLRVFYDDYISFILKRNYDSYSSKKTDIFLCKKRNINSSILAAVIYVNKQVSETD